MKKKKKNKLYSVITLLLLIIGALLWDKHEIEHYIPQLLQTLFIDQPTVQPDYLDIEQQNPFESAEIPFSEDAPITDLSGYITYYPLDALNRPTGAEAVLTPEMVGTGTSANSKIRPPGFISGKEPHGHARGHLIGRQLGGSGDDPRNLVTLYQNPVNTPYMTKYENMVRNALDEGDIIRYRVIPIYEGDNLMCSQVKMEAMSLTPQGMIQYTVYINNTPN